MGSSRWIDDDQFRRKRTPSFPNNESIVLGSAQKQRRWKIINTLLCRWWYDWNCFSHNYFCWSAQYLRSTLGCVWGIQCLSDKNKETCCDRAIWPTFRASRLIDNDTHTLDWNFCTRTSSAEAQRTSGKASTTRSIDKDLYWCRIPENSWSRTIRHDKTNWRVLPICRAVTCRECTLPRDDKSTDPKGWIRGNNKIGPVLEVTTSYPHGKHGVEIRIEYVNKDNSH